MITRDELRQFLNYDPKTGLFTWAVGRRGVSAGSKAGWKNDSGYLLIGLQGRKGRSYRAHQLAWLWMTGNWPEQQIDHKNGLRADNRWGNLRLADQTLNSQNIRRAKSHNTVGVLGVRKTPNGRFAAGIVVAKRHMHLGTFDTAEQAHATYVLAKRQLHEGCTI